MADAVTTPATAATTATRASHPTLPGWVAPALLAAGCGLWLLGLHRIDPSGLDGFGLVKRLTLFTWLGYVLIVGAATLELLHRVRTWLLTACTAALVVTVYSLQALSYGAARLPVGWLHVGFAEQIMAHGAVLHDFDTRFSWPGFFTTASFWSAAAGFTTAEPLIKWAPVVLLGLSTLAMYSLAVGILGHGRAAWIATLLFVASDWTEQEYFSPQGMAYVLLLAGLAIAVQTQSAGFAPTSVRLRPWRRERVASPAGSRIMGQVLLLLIILALAPSHQLTPFMLAGFLIVLLLFGRLAPAWLPVLALMVPCAWFVLAGQEFWVAQLSLLTESEGLSGSISQGIAGRVAGSSGHRLMVLGRIALTCLLGGSFAVSLLVSWRRRTSPWLLGCLAAAGFAMAVLQPYGGEIFMRCYLFALPWFAIGIARCLGDGAWAAGARRLATVTAGGLLLVALVGTVIVRGGNDAYVAFDTADVTAVRAAESAAQPGDLVVAPLWFAPLRMARVGDVRQVSAEELADRANPCVTEDELYRCLVDNHVTYVILSPAQHNAGIILNGYSPQWMDVLRHRLEAEGRYRVVYADNDRTVLEAPRA